jgi:hypothetical protein
MRIFVADDRSFLATSKHISRQIPELKLSKVQEALSRALGYRDFHDFQFEHKSAAPSHQDQQITEFEFRQRWTKIIVDAAMILDVDDGTMQYYLAQTRLTGDRKWTLDDHLAIRAHCWSAQGIVGLRGRKHGGFGRIIEDDTKLGEDGYIVNSGKPSAILGLSGFWQCADYELAPLGKAIDPFVPYSHYVPYGYKPMADRKVYFGREYFPLWIVHGDGGIERPNPWEHFHAGSDAVWFATTTGENFLSEKTRSLALNSLAEDGISGLPVFANATPSILKSGTTSLSAAVDALKSHHVYRRSWTPTLTKYSDNLKHIERGGDKSVIVAENDWERLLSECSIDLGNSSDPSRYFEHGQVHFYKEASGYA